MMRVVVKLELSDYCQSQLEPARVDNDGNVIPGHRGVRSLHTCTQDNATGPICAPIVWRAGLRSGASAFDPATT